MIYLALITQEPQMENLVSLEKELKFDFLLSKMRSVMPQGQGLYED